MFLTRDRDISRDISEYQEDNLRDQQRFFGQI